MISYTLNHWQRISLFVVTAVMAFILTISILAQPSGAQWMYEHCSNGFDDDSDTTVDCLDAMDCAFATNCEEDCFNGVDDDGDGSVDCEDLWCAWQEPACW